MGVRLRLRIAMLQVRLLALVAASLAGVKVDWVRERMGVEAFALSEFGTLPQR